MPDSVHITEHFSLAELTRTSTGTENDPDVQSGANLVRLAETILEPIRALLGVPLIVHSGYRCAAVNKAVGGSINPPSAHTEGRACDFHPGDGMDIKQAFDKIRLSEIPYDKILIEHHGGSWWIHVQVAKRGNTPRRLAFTASIGPDGPHYAQVR